MALEQVCYEYFDRFLWNEWAHPPLLKTEIFVICHNVNVLSY